MNAPSKPGPSFIKNGRYVIGCGGGGGGGGGGAGLLTIVIDETVTADELTGEPVLSNVSMNTLGAFLLLSGNAID
jgi:hypothetical protein